MLLSMESVISETVQDYTQQSVADDSIKNYTFISPIRVGVNNIHLFSFAYIQNLRKYNTYCEFTCTGGHRIDSPLDIPSFENQFSWN